ncbi:hypothetical protein ES703_41719 [subsurface metagenome]
MIVKCDCGHYEFSQVMVKQLGKTRCRDCARKINKRLNSLVKEVLKSQFARKG